MRTIARAAALRAPESLFLDRSRYGPETLCDDVGVNGYKRRSLEATSSNAKAAAASGFLVPYCRYLEKVKELSRRHFGRDGLRFQTSDRCANTSSLRPAARRLSTAMVKAPLAPPGSALLEDLTGHKSTFAASELWAKNSAVIFVARRPG